MRRLDTADRMLRRHFLRCFLDNDVVSLRSDRHEAFAFIVGAVFATTMFLALGLGIKFLLTRFTPGQASLAALDDRLIFIWVSMIVMGLAATSQWNDLALDSRDTMILGTLPLSPRRIVRAKFLAIVLCAAGCAFTLNAAPTVLYQLLLASNVPILTGGLLRLMLVHALVTTAAGTFAFLVVLATRELTHVVLGGARFTRASLAVQSGFVLLFCGMSMLSPLLLSRTLQSWFTATRGGRLLPPLWFLGLYESLAGDILDEAPRMYAGATLATDMALTQAYRALRPAFEGVADVAVYALGAVTLLAVTAWLWNGRRLPPPHEVAPVRKGHVGMAMRLARGALVRRPETWTAFSFVVPVFFRSGPHRVLMAMCFAAATALTVTTAVRAWPGPGGGSVHLALLALQTYVLGIVAAGARHAVELPVDLPARWVFYVAEPRSQRAYLDGVKYALIAVVCIPAILALVPLHMTVLGPAAAAGHALYGVVVAVTMGEALFQGYAELPFATSYEGGRFLRSGMAPFMVAVLVAGIGLATIERLALESVPAFGLTTAGILLLVAAWRWGDRHAAEKTAARRFDELHQPTIRLDLFR